MKKRHPGEIIRLLRQAQGVSQLMLAEAIGTSRPYITEIESGRRDPTLTTLRKVAQFFEIPLALLVPEFASFDKEIADKLSRLFADVLKTKSESLG